MTHRLVGKHIVIIHVSQIENALTAVAVHKQLGISTAIHGIGTVRITNQRIPFHQFVYHTGHKAAILPVLFIILLQLGIDDRIGIPNALFIILLPQIHLTKHGVDGILRDSSCLV